MNEVLVPALLSCLEFASASSTSVNLRIPASLTVANPCAPADVVSPSSNVHLVGNVDSDSSRTRINLHVNLQDSGGTAPAGRMYRAHLNGRADMDLASTVLPASARGSVYARLVSQGPTDNFKFRLVSMLQSTVRGESPSTIRPPCPTAAVLGKINPLLA